MDDRFANKKYNRYYGIYTKLKRFSQKDIQYEITKT